ncbi:PepSY-associated TM helix domain-containing protein [Ideonella sp. DXS29W]|uniref:PepSY-associated TM helix domain-containing protein n=1 Tax=Ideonella lacteola TaxID=2984193 RepID=A0ABU9BJ73_9BURK
MDQGLTSVAVNPRPSGVEAAQRRARWLKAILPWHWISSAITLVGLLAFALTGITLNHAVSIEARPTVRTGQFDLSAEDRAALGRGAPAAEGSARAPLPAGLTSAVQEQIGLPWDAATEAEWSRDEIYLSLPRPGGDAWLRIDRERGIVEWEDSDRGWIAWLNDLHKARHTGVAWRWFIDVFAIACSLAAVTGLLLLALHARRRPITWPLVIVGFLLPWILAIWVAH